MPRSFDQFLTEQLAGDELADWRRAETFDERTVSLLTATGFLRNEVDKQVAELTKADATLRQQTPQRALESCWNALPEEIRADVKQAVELARDKRNDARMALAAKHEAALKIT